MITLRQAIAFKRRRDKKRAAKKKAKMKATEAKQTMTGTIQAPVEEYTTCTDGTGRVWRFRQHCGRRFRNDESTAFLFITPYGNWILQEGDTFRLLSGAEAVLAATEHKICVPYGLRPRVGTGGEV